MAVNLTIEIARTFTVGADIQTVFALLSDVEQSAAHFPKVDKLEALAPNTYRWEMQKNGVENYAIQTIYACVYQSDAEAYSVTWEPVKGVGNGQVNGAWQLSSVKGGTQCEFRTHGELELEIPRLLKMAVAPIAKHEFNALVDQYVGNLKNALAS